MSLRLQPFFELNCMTESTYRIQGATGEWEVVIGLAACKLARKVLP
jgi:hypothetical protein